MPNDETAAAWATTVRLSATLSPVIPPSRSPCCART